MSIILYVSYIYTEDDDGACFPIREERMKEKEERGLFRRRVTRSRVGAVSNLASLSRPASEMLLLQYKCPCALLAMC